VPPPNITLGDSVSLMLLVNSHKLKMTAASTSGREYNQRAAIIEGLCAGPPIKIIQFFGYPRSTVYDVVAKYNDRTIKRKFQYASKKESLERTHRENPYNGRKDPSADFGRSRTIVVKISINCGCKRANNVSNCRGRSSAGRAAPAHTSYLVQNWISDTHNIDMFWSKEFWPPNSPDLNPLDYVWSVVERVTNKSRHPNVTSLWTAIEATFVDIDSATLQRACERFRSRIEAVIEADGDYIE